MSILHNEGHEREGNKKGLITALSITGFIMTIELFGGIFSKSLALLSDAGHMLSDFASLALTLFAIWFASKPASNKNTFGYYRMEILAALFNALVLIGGSVMIVFFAVNRMLHPVDVGSTTMIFIALIGLIANVSSAVVLAKQGDIEGNLNVRSAYLHVLADAFTSVGVIVSGLLIWAFGWTAADPIMSVITTLVILKGAVTVLKNSLHILMEGAPEDIKQDDIVEVLTKIEGVKEVHDVHVWTISSGFDSLSCHILVDKKEDNERVLKQAIQKIESHFPIRHMTIQIEKEDYAS